MSSAGKILILPKDEWSSSVAYQNLDIVTHNNGTYISKKASTGVEPGTDPETWMLLVTGGGGTAAVDIATLEAAGIVKPDGETITIEEDGTIHGASKITEITRDEYNALEDKSGLYFVKDTDDEVEEGEDDIFNMLEKISPRNHRMMFRGKNLGTSLTDAQIAAIQDGSFKDLWLGDYWVINNNIWRIVDFDYWMNAGDTPFANHHLVVMPDNCLYNAQMNTSNVTTGGYVGSAMYTSNLTLAKTIVNNVFGSHALSHRGYFTNAVTNGRPSGGGWFDSVVDLPNEIQMYGHLHFSPVPDGSTAPSIYTIDKTQFALFTVAPDFISNKRESQWLRDVVSAANFARIGGSGDTTFLNASISGGVRPPVAIG